jgi:hypothetical protein
MQAFEANFLSLYRKSIEENFYWQYCSFNTYKENTLKSFSEWRVDYPDGNIFDFIGRERNFIEAWGNNERINFPYFTTIDKILIVIDLNFFSEDTKYKIRSSQERKLQFLKSGLSQIVEPQQAKPLVKFNKKNFMGLSFNEFLREISVDFGSDIYSLDPDKSISLIDISHYIKIATDNFNPELCFKAYYDIANYQSILMANSLDDCYKEYKDNGWEIPKTTDTSGDMLKKIYIERCDKIPDDIDLMLPKKIVDDTDKMLAKTHPNLAGYLNYALKIITDKMDDFREASEPTELQQEENLHPEIFKGKGFLVFGEFIKNSTSWQYDCSYAYRVMHDHKPSLIHDHIKPGMFKTWVNENYPEKEMLEEIKTLNVVQIDNRDNTFNKAKKTFIKQKE